MAVDFRPLIFWEGFPPCGLMIKRVVEAYGDDIVVIGTRPAVPFSGLEEVLGVNIVWFDDPNEIWARRHEFSDRNFIVHTGWGHKGWLKFDRWMKRRGARIVFAADNCWKGSLRQLIGAVWFRVWLSRHFDAALVPGRSARRLIEFLGMPSERIFEGYYGAYEGFYSEGLPVSERRSEFLFVGQLIRRKGIDVLISAFREYRARGGSWELRVIGSGPFSGDCVGEGIIYEGFLQASEVAERMAMCGALVVPSREDHWATVVCEAAATGTPVIASKWVGAVSDLVRHGVNGLVFHRMTPLSLSEQLSTLSGWSIDQRRIASNICLSLAETYRSDCYMAAFESARQILCIK